MPYVDWRMRGPEIANCNCDWGCPCQFNASPTRGGCSAVMAMRIDEGHFGDVPLSGLGWVGLYSWPGAIYEGLGESFMVVDRQADATQRQAILAILAGLETEPGATFFTAFAASIDKHHEPAFLPIGFDIDMNARTGSVRIEGLLDTRVEPIVNPVTGKPYRARVSLPDGFEFREAEFASGSTHAGGPIGLHWTSRHAHLAILDLSSHGVA